MKILIYTDGACSGNPGPGGYAFYMMWKNQELSVRGCKRNTTNNCMELTAVVKAIKHAVDIPLNEYQREIQIFSDSAYVINSLEQGWLLFWANNDWKTKTGYEIKNKELWQQLYELVYQGSKYNKFKFKKVKGHSGDKYNELVDRLAKKSIQDLKAKMAPSVEGKRNVSCS